MKKLFLLIVIFVWPLYSADINKVLSCSPVQIWTDEFKISKSAMENVKGIGEYIFYSDSNEYGNDLGKIRELDYYAPSDSLFGVNVQYFVALSESNDTIPSIGINFWKVNEEVNYPKLTKMEPIVQAEITRLLEWGIILNTKEETDSIVSKIINDMYFPTMIGSVQEISAEDSSLIFPRDNINCTSYISMNFLDNDEYPLVSLIFEGGVFPEYYNNLPSKKLSEFLAGVSQKQIKLHTTIRKISSNSFLLNKSNVYVKSFDLQGKLVEQKFIQSNVYTAPFLPIILKVENQSAILLK